MASMPPSYFLAMPTVVPLYGHAMMTVVQKVRSKVPLVPSYDLVMAMMVPFYGYYGFS